MSLNARLLAVMIFASLASGAANAQENVFEKARPDYKPDGIKVGSFNFLPAIELKETLDGNIYSTGNGQIEDFITTASPTLALNSNWNNHELDLYAGSDVVAYADETSESFEDYNIGTKGRLDILRGMYVSGGLDYSLNHQDRGSPDNVANSTEPTVFDLYNAKAGFYRGISKTSFALDSDYKKYDFHDGSTAVGTQVENDDRDRDEYKNTAKLGYEFIPNYMAFVSSSYNTRYYDHDPVLSRDSDGYDLTVGTDINISGKAKGEIFVGYMEQDYSDNSLKDIDGAAFGASLLWNPTQITSLDLGVVRSIEETSLAGLSGYVSTTYSAKIEHELLRNILLGTNVAFSNNDYEGTIAPQRKDDVFTAGAEVRYLLNKNASAKLAYEYTTRDTNAASQDYFKNAVMVGLGVGF